MAARRRKTKRKAVPLDRRNEERLQGRKVELEHFLYQHEVDICFLSESFRNPGQAFRLASYVCHRTDRKIAGGGTATPVRRGLVQHSVLVPVWPTCRQLSVDLWDSLRLTFRPLPPTDWREPVCLFLRWISGPVGRRPELQKCRLDLTAKRKTRKSPTWLCWWKIFWRRSKDD